MPCNSRPLCIIQFDSLTAQYEARRRQFPCPHAKFREEMFLAFFFCGTVVSYATMPHNSQQPVIMVTVRNRFVQFGVPGLGGLKETKMFLPHPRVKVSIVGSLRDREVACSASDRQGSNFESCVWRTVSSQSSHHPQGVLLAQFSLYVHKGGLKPDSFHFCPIWSWISVNYVHRRCNDVCMYQAIVFW